MEQRQEPFVLVVDDERLIADTLTQSLNQNGFIASACYSGHDAIRLCRELSPDFVISDVVMPEISGIEVALAVERLLPGCRVVLITGQPAASALLENAQSQGHDFDVLTKPVRPEELMNYMSQHRAPSKAA
jgi:DNA-binding NtrC family response regulator